MCLNPVLCCLRTDACAVTKGRHHAASGIRQHASSASSRHPCACAVPSRVSGRRRRSRWEKHGAQEEEVSQATFSTAAPCTRRPFGPAQHARPKVQDAPVVPRHVCEHAVVATGTRGSSLPHLPRPGSACLANEQTAADPDERLDVFPAKGVQVPMSQFDVNGNHPELPLGSRLSRLPQLD